MARDYARTKNKRPASRAHQEESEGGRNWRWPLAGILIALFIAGIFYLKQQSDKLAAEQGTQGDSIIQQTMKQNIPETAPSKSANNKFTTGKPGVKATAETPSSPPPQPKFDFYTMLPNGQAGNTASQAKTPAANTTPIVTPPAPVPATQPAPPVTNAPAPATAANAPVTSAKQQPTKKQLEKNAQADTSDLIAMEIKKLNSAQSIKAKADTSSAKTAGHYILQLGVFKNYNDADQFKAQLILQGMEVSIKDFKKQNNTMYRVFMGPYPSLATAKKQQHLLEENQIKSKIAKD